MSDTLRRMKDSDNTFYEKAAQSTRQARDALADVEEKTFGDHLSVIALGVIEGYLSDKHETDTDA